ncbi:MAG: hypothetical protein WC549_08130 [Actinomycetota bacterium]
MVKKVDKELKFLKGWQLLLTADALYYVARIINNEGFGVIASIFGILALILLVASIVVGIINIAKRRHQKRSRLIGMMILGILLLLAFGL